MVDKQPTDRERVESLFRSLGIEPSKGNGYDKPAPGEVMYAANNGNVQGYSGFVALFRFELDGKFISFGVWE